MTLLLRYCVLVLFTCAGGVAIQALATANPAYPFLWALPATYIIVTAMVLLTGKDSRRFRWLEYAVSALWFVRLVLIPWLMLTAGPKYAAIRPQPAADYYQRGILYMAYEILVTGVVIVLVRAYFWRSHSISHAVSFRPGSYVPQAVLIVVGGAALVFPAVSERFSFFTSTITGTAREITSSYDASFSSLANLTNLARLAVPGVLITLALKAQRVRPNLAPIVVAMVGCVMVNMVFVVTSRASFFVPLVAATIVLALAFPRWRIFLLVSAGSALLLMTVIVTINKSFAMSPQSTVGDMANYLSTYLMGPREYAIGARAVDLYGSQVNEKTLFGDFLGNIPVASNLVDPLNRTSQFYNWTYLGRNVGVGGGYIAPASIQSAFYVGWFLGPVAPPLGLIPAVLGLRYLQRAQQDPSMSYVAAFAVVVALLYHTNTFSTVVAFLAFPILPLLLLSSLDWRLARSVKEDRRRHERHSYSSA